MKRYCHKTIFPDLQEIRNCGKAKERPSMSWVRVPIANCKTASIRRTPWIPLRDADISGIRDGPTLTDDNVKLGDYVEVDVEQICYSWTDKKFYKVRNPEGWIYEGCINLGDDLDG